MHCAPTGNRLDNHMNQRHRRSIRLKDYDYTQHGAYFVTICAHERRRVFGNIVAGDMVLNAWGRVVQSCWDKIPAHFPMVELDAFVVMPNHVHGIIVIVDIGVRATHGSPVHGAPVHGAIGHRAPVHGSPVLTHPTQPNGPKPNSLGAIIGQFKSAVTRRINRLSGAPGHPVWQRNYYEHIVRSEESLNAIRAYIADNPAKWAQDTLFTEP